MGAWDFDSQQPIVHQVLGELAKARLLFEREATPATEQATVHIDHARSFLFDHKIVTPDLELEEFRRLCRRADFLLGAKYSYLCCEHFADFLDQVFGVCLSNTDLEISPKYIIQCGRDSRFTPPDITSIGPILQFLRDQEILQYIHGAIYRLASHGAQLARHLR